MSADTAKNQPVPHYTKKDFVSDFTVRWCPGCGDYAILNAVQKVFAELGVPRENFVVVSGIGCSSRFPYYMNTYGFHGIHGRAPAIASGLKVARPDLSVWVMTGDGDGLSIGGNHFLHTLRRNVDLKVLLFNNRIYGLTKGQYSPTSVKGTKTPTSPYGSLENPVHPISVALAAEATFVARSVDILGAHLREVIARAAQHRGSAFVEILQNCVIFNNGAFRDVTDPKNRADRLLMLKDGEPLVFGRDRDKGIRLNGVIPEVVKVGSDGVPEEELLRHNEKSEDPFLAFLLAQLWRPGFPLPVGVFREVESESYEQAVHRQIQEAREKVKPGGLDDVLRQGEIWDVPAKKEE